MIDYSKEVLDNGLTLIHHYDETTPFVVVNTLYKVGSKHEDENRTGFAATFAIGVALKVGLGVEKIGVG